jgi:hypothetical protein
MPRLRGLIALTGLLAASACSSAATPSDAGQPRLDATPLDCRLGESSDLPGASIHILRDDCTFTRAQARAGISIPYQVVIEQSMDVVPAPSPGSYCYQPTESGLLILEMLQGSNQRYCLCDRGLPYPSVCQMTTTLHPGTYPAAFTWDGVNWSGPSDTQNPKGAAFPAGVYRLDITAKGLRDATDAGSSAFTVSASFSVNLVD